MRRALASIVLLAACAVDEPVHPSDYTLEVAVDTLAEDAGTVDEVATLVLDAPAVDPIVFWISTDGAPQVQPSPAEVTVRPGKSRATLGLQVVDDELIASDRTWTVFVHSDTLPAQEFVVTIEDDEPRGLVLEGPDPLVEGVSGVLVLRTAHPLVEPVELTLEAEPPALVDLPAQFTLSDHQSQWSIPIEALDDELLQGERSVTVSVWPERLLTAPDALAVPIEDDEPATLALQALATGLTEGAGTVPGGARLTLGAPPAADTTVALASDAPEVLTVAPEVTVPAGSAAVDFDLVLIDDALLEPDTTATLTATAPGLEGATLAVPVADDEVVDLQLAVQSATVTEGAGELPGFGTVSLGVTTALDQPVALGSSDPGEVAVPDQVVVPAGADQVSFAITVPDDAWLDFDQSTTLSAAAKDALDEVPVLVADDESPQLTVVVEDVEVWEDDGTLFDIVTVETAARVERALELAIDTADAGELLVQYQSTVPAGGQVAEVSIYPVPDDEPDFDQAVEITASAPDCLTGAGTVVVRDDDTGYAVQLLQDEGIEQWVGFAGLPGLMYQTDWAFAWKILIPAGADTFGYTFFRGSAFEDLKGDFSLNVRLDSPTQVSSMFLPLSMQEGDQGITLTEGTWHTYVIQYDHDAQIVELYVDGVLVDDEADLPWDDRDDDNLLVWGGQQADPGWGLGDLYNESDATFAHMAIWQRLLTAAEIAAYDGTVDRADPDLVLSTAIGPDRVWDVVGDRHGTVHGEPTFYRP